LITAQALEDLPTDTWPTWQKDISSKVNVGLTSRNPDIRILKTVVIDINDSMIDVYFEFSRYRGYSMPFRPGPIEVTFRKTQQKTTQTEKKGDLSVVVTGPLVKTYTAGNSSFGPRQSSDLVFDYTMLDEKQAGVLLGRGIADNFYVLKVSVVNNGAKKVTIPLAAIQAEVEWVRGRENDNPDSDPRVEYVEGSPLISPSPLSAVSAYFDAYNKTQGKRAVLFNILDGSDSAT
jgi:hypothetical protein